MAGGGGAAAGPGRTPRQLSAGSAKAHPSSSSSPPSSPSSDGFQAYPAITAEKLPSFQPSLLPRQSNETDCGVYLLLYLQHFLSPLPLQITQEDINSTCSHVWPPLDLWFREGDVQQRRQLLQDALVFRMLQG